MALRAVARLHGEKDEGIGQQTLATQGRPPKNRKDKKTRAKLTRKKSP